MATTSTDLELWNGHLKGSLCNVPRGLSDLQQQADVRRVQRTTRVWAHGHPQLPLDVHKLQQDNRAGNSWTQNTCERAHRRTWPMLSMRWASCWACTNAPCSLHNTCSTWREAVDHLLLPSSSFDKSSSADSLFLPPDLDKLKHFYHYSLKQEICNV